MVISLTKEEADRISDLISKAGCHEDEEGDSKKKRSLSSGLVAARCAVPAVLEQIGPDGTLPELRNFQPQGPPLQFRNEDIVRAANDVLGMARDLANLVVLAPEQIEQIAMMIFALAVEKFVDHVSIGVSNWIHASTLQGTSSTACSAKQCTASCEQIGIIEKCVTSCSTATVCPVDGDPYRPSETVVTVTTKLWYWDAMTGIGGRHPDTPTPAPDAKKEPARQCNDFKDNKYVSLGTVETAVSKFCDEDAVQKGRLDKGSGSIVRKYFDNTPGALQISMDFAPGITYGTGKEDCHATFMAVVNGCDAPKGGFNPANWKSGGSLTVFSDPKAKNEHAPKDKPHENTDVKYWVLPLSKRVTDPPADPKQGHCHVDYKFGMPYNGGEVSGAGWAEADNGDAIKQQLRGCALFPAPGFHLDYEQNLAAKDRHNDGREWTAYFHTGIGQRKCTGHALESAGGFNSGCDGGGA